MEDQKIAYNGRDRAKKNEEEENEINENDDDVNKRAKQRWG